MQKENDLIFFLQTSPLGQILLKEELEILSEFIQVLSVPDGTNLWSQKKDTEYLYMVKSGVLGVESSNQEMGLAVFKQFDIFGEGSHLLKSKRKGAIVAKNDATVLEIDLEAIQASKKAEVLYGKILHYVAKNLKTSLENVHLLLNQSIQENLEVSHAHNQIGIVIVHIFISMAAWFTIGDFVKSLGFYDYEKLISRIFAPLMFLLFASSVVFIIRKSPYSLGFYGFTLEKFWKYASEGVFCSIPILLFLIALKWIAIHYVPIFQDYPLFTSFENIYLLLFWGGLYAIFTPIQEAIVRGVIQSCFRNFFKGRYKSFFAILVANLIFQLMHSMRGPFLSLGSFFLGLFWGILFEKQKSIVGVSVSHFLIGYVGFFILGFDHMVDVLEFYDIKNRFIHQKIPF